MTKKIKKEKEVENIESANKFGMFKAVYTPSVLTILGVIMYQRLGLVVGESGLVMTILIIGLSHVISITTGLAVASIATNRTVKAGGNYYIISRSLGLSIGGAIGVAFYFALAISVSLYLLGFAEAFNGYLGLPTTIWYIRITALVALLSLTILTYISTSFALKSQYFVFLAIILSIVSLLMGDGNSKELLKDLPAVVPKDPKYSFEVLFAIFFPAVTGFTAGVNMSGDLKDPKRSIPIGTILSIITGFIVYVGLAVYFAYFVDERVLLSYGETLWFKISAFPILVAFGAWGATLSSALGSILGAPRTLQALSSDNITPKFFEKGRGELNEPTNALWLTVLVAALAITFGELDFIARILTMIFLTVYAFISLSYTLEAWVNPPSFRPSFKSPYQLSLIGTISAFMLMFKLDMVAMILAVLFMGGLYLLFKRKRFKSVGDTWEGVWRNLVQLGLLKLKSSEKHGRNWIPNVLVMGGPPEEREHLIEFSRYFIQDRGMITYLNLIEGKIKEKIEDLKTEKEKLHTFMNEHYPTVFAKIEITEDIYKGIGTIAQSYGLPGMESNSVVLGWITKENKMNAYVDMLLDLMLLEKNILALNYKENKKFGRKKTIDVYWGGLAHNGILMLMVANLIASSWKHSKTRIIMIVNKESEVEKTKNDVTKIIEDARLDAIPFIVSKEDYKYSIADTISMISKETDLTILGLRKPADDNVDFIKRTNVMLEKLNTTLLVKASDEFSSTPQIVFNE